MEKASEIHRFVNIKSTVLVVRLPVFDIIIQVKVGWFQDYKNTELYFYDEGSDCMYNFINDDIKLDFEIPGGLQYLIDEAEKADKENDLGTYIAYADVIDTAAKNYCAAGKITMKDWDKVCARYEQ